MDARVYVILTLLFLLSTCTCLQAQGRSKDDSLYKQIAHMDSVMFNAFNNRDVKTFDSLFTPDLEFYHDKGGLTGLQHTLDFMKSVAENDNGLKRVLVEGSLE